MSILFDLLLVLVIVVSVVIGVKRGFVKNVLNTFSLVFSVVLTMLLSSPVAKWIKNKYIMESVTNKVRGFFDKEIAKLSDGADLNTLMAEKSESLSKTFSRFGVDIGKVYEEQVSGGTENLVERVSEKIASPIASTISFVIAVIAVFVLSFIALKLLSVLLDKVFSLPGLNTINKSLGFAFGLVCGLIYVNLICLALGKMLPFMSGSLSEAINNSKLMSWFTDYNIFNFLLDKLLK